MYRSTAWYLPFNLFFKDSMTLVNLFVLVAQEFPESIVFKFRKKQNLMKQTIIRNFM